MTLKVGLFVGREWSFPAAFIDEVNNRGKDVRAEYISIGGTMMDELAWAAFSGGLVPGVVAAFVPGTVGIALSATTGTVTLNELVATTPESRLEWIRHLHWIQEHGATPDSF